MWPVPKNKQLWDNIKVRLNERYGVYEHYHKTFHGDHYGTAINKLVVHIPHVTIIRENIYEKQDVYF